MAKTRKRRLHGEVFLAAAKSPRRRHSVSEKPRIVELALREGASIDAIAREQGVHPNTLSRWTALYRVGKLSAESAPAPRSAKATSGTFVPVTITPGAHVARAPADSPSIVQITLSCGSMLLIEADALDGGLVCAFVAQLHR